MATPTRPVQDAIIDPVWGQWVHDTIAPLNSLSLGVASKNIAADNLGQMTFSAAELGLSTIAGGVISVERDPGNAGFAVFILETFLASPTVLAARMGLVVLSSGTVSIAVNGARVFHAIAWGASSGSGAGIIRDPELKPGPDDERPEIEPQEDTDE